MKNFVLAIALSAPVAATAQDKAAMCAAVMDGLHKIDDRAEAVSQSAFFMLEQMTAFADRIGGDVGEQLQSDAARYQTGIDSDADAIRNEASDLRLALSAYCAQP